MNSQGKTLTPFSARKNGRRVVFFSARPNPAHRALVETGAGGDCVAGWFMRLAYSGVTWKTRLYNFILGPVVAPIEALRFFKRYDVFLVPPHALPLGYWIKKWRPMVRVIYFNHCPFLADLQRKSWLFRSYVKVLLRAVDGVHSGSWLPDSYAAEMVSVPRVISHLFASEEFRELDHDPDAEDLIIVGALHATKGIREGIAVYQTLRGRLRRPVGLTIIGNGPLRQEIDAIASADKGIRVLGQQPLSVVAGEIARSNILLMLSRFDTFPAAVLEAARVGVIPLMSNGVGSCDLFPSELVVPVGDHEAAVKRLLWLYGLSPKDREAMRERVRAVGCRFTRRRQCARFHEAIAGLVGRIEIAQSAYGFHRDNFTA